MPSNFYDGALLYSEQVALNIDWDVYGLINKINKIFRRKMWVVDEAVHM